MVSRAGRLVPILGRRLISSSVDKAEVSKFSDLASTWWQYNGPMWPLHAMNTSRVQFITESLNQVHSSYPMEGFRVLDVGCGAGILTESLTRLGAQVTGLDASKEAIEAAMDHAHNDPVLHQNLRYHHGTVENLIIKEEEKFNVVTCLEVVEHVNNPREFLSSLEKLLKDDGHLFLSTISRTTKSYLLSIIAAEYITRIVPIGTHDWHKFITPSQLADMATSAGLAVHSQAGIVFDPLRCQFQLSFDDLDNNYIVHCRKSKQSLEAVLDETTDKKS